MYQASLFYETFNAVQEIIDEVENVLSKVLDGDQAEHDILLNKLSFIINKQVRINIDQYLFQYNTPYNSMPFNAQYNLQFLPYVNNNYFPSIVPNIFALAGQPQLMNQQLKKKNKRNKRKKNKSNNKLKALNQSKKPKLNDESKKQSTPVLYQWHELSRQNETINIDKIIRKIQLFLLI